MPYDGVTTQLCPTKRESLRTVSLSGAYLLMWYSQREYRQDLGRLPVSVLAGEGSGVVPVFDRTSPQLAVTLAYPTPSPQAALNDD